LNILCHRGLWKRKDERNTINSLVNAHIEGFGVELDLRDRGSQIVISHDIPTKGSELFDSYLNELKENHYNNNTTIAINIKADGLSRKIKKIINEYNISNYFTFDMSNPEMLRYNNAGVIFFTRLSEYEMSPVLEKEAMGIWLDAFNKEWYSIEDINLIVASGKRICFVSPELHGRVFNKQWAMLKDMRHDDFLLCTDQAIKAKGFFG
jgi:hypothetical protein